PTASPAVRCDVLCAKDPVEVKVGAQVAFNHACGCPALMDILAAHAAKAKKYVSRRLIAE
ncbi:MAG TPA: hypothetical protein VFZ14_16570, partial [Burkholderiales bacterium]|nr:hypothetical protein [Burkholderiales bacterium]